MSQLRNKKQTYVALVRQYHKMRDLNDMEAVGFERMFRACRSQEEQHQVFEAMMHVIKRMDEGMDRYALLHRGDLLGED